MKNPQTKERPPTLPKTSKDKMTVAEEEKDVKSGVGAPDIIVGHKRSPSAQRRRQSQPASSRRSQSRGGVVPEAQRLSRGGSEVRESSVEIMEEEVVVRKFSSTSEQQKSVDRLSRVTVTREKRTCEGEVKKGNGHCHGGQRSRSTSPEKRSHSIRRKPTRSVGRARPESSSGGSKREEDPRRSSPQQKNSSRSKSDIGRSQSISRGEVMQVGAESAKGGTGKLAPGSRSSSSGPPTPRAKVLKTTDEGSMSRSRKEITTKEIKTKEKAFKEVKVCKSGSSTDVKQDSEAATANVVKETGILHSENGVVEESITATEAIIRFESETAAFASSSGVKSSVEVIGEICEVGSSGASDSSKQISDVTSVKSSSRSATTGVKHITGISKLILANKENSSNTEQEKIKANQERANASSSQAGAMALKKALEKEEKRGKALISSSETSSSSASSQSGAMALKKTLEKGEKEEKLGEALISSFSETSSQSVAASNELKTAQQKIQTVSRQTNVLKSSSTTKSNAASEHSSQNVSKAYAEESSKSSGGRTTMVVTLHPNMGERHGLCSFKEKKDSEDNWVWRAEVEPGQGRESGVYGLQISFSALPQDVDVKVIRDTDTVDVKH